MREKRSSNIELLRIMAMLMIVAYHIYCHCVKVQLTNDNLPIRIVTGWFTEPIFYKRLLILCVFTPMGKIGDNLFILISGYFMLEKGKGIDLFKLSKKLLLQLVFSGLVLTILSSIVYNIFSNLVIYPVGINIMNSGSWFVGYYFLVILTAKLWLNEYLLNSNKNRFATVVIVLFALSQFSWIISGLNDIANGMGIYLTGLFVYSLGGYIKLYKPFDKIRAYILWVIIIFCFGLVALSFYNSTMSSINGFYAHGESMFTQYLPDYFDYNLVPIVIAVSVFNLFIRMKSFYSKIINGIAASTFMVYLLHDNSFVYSIWENNEWVIDLIENPARYVGKHLLWTIVTFAIGSLFYFVYLGIVFLIKKSKRIIIKSGE